MTEDVAFAQSLAAAIVMRAMLDSRLSPRAVEVDPHNWPSGTSPAEAAEYVAAAPISTRTRLALERRASSLKRSKTDA